MKPLYSLLLTLALQQSSCQSDEQPQPCNGSCATFKGRLLTSGGQPLGGVGLSVSWSRYHGPVAGFTVRKKAVAVTAPDGTYSLSFAVADDELRDGLFKLSHSADKSRYYIIGDDVLHAPMRMSRDTIITFPDYLIPRKAALRLLITNPAQVPSGGFMTSFNSCYGRSTVFSSAISGGAGHVFWDSLPTQNPLDMPGGQPILIHHFKRTTNGIPTSTDTLTIAPGKTQTYTVTY